MAASTSALPPPTCTAWREAGRRHRQLLFLLRGRPSVAVCFEACAGWRVRRLCLPAVPCSAGGVPTCHAMPTALLNVLAPIQVCLPPFCSFCFILLATCSFPCAPGSSLCEVQATCLQAARTVPLAAATWACSGGPCDGPFY